MLHENTRLTAMTGTSYMIDGVSEFDSNGIRQRQREFQRFGIVSLRRSTGLADVPVSVSSRYNSLRYSPDPVADLLYLGNAQSAARQITSDGVQVEARRTVVEMYTLRGGSGLGVGNPQHGLRWAVLGGVTQRF